MPETSGSSGSGEVSLSSGSGSGHDNDDELESGDDSSGPGDGDDDDVDEAELGGGGDPAPFAVETDSLGRERRAGEVLFFGRGSDLDGVAAQGFAIMSRHRLHGEDADVVARIGARKGESVDRAVDTIRRLAPDARISPNYLFRASAGDTVGGARGPVSVRRAPTPTARIGIIDTGANKVDPLLRAAIVAARSFGGAYTPKDHGTSVAWIAAQNGVEVSIADVFDLDEKGRAVASGDAIVRALDWFTTQDLVVVNISIAGPSSDVLSEMVARLHARGMVIVAAAGNEGPGAPPAFPAALDGVLAVTAVDREGRVYRRANRGAYVDFAAQGVDVAVDAEGAPRRVSGTSFAAPVVSAVLARRLHGRSRRDADAAVGALALEAIDLGARGRDPVYGWGEVR